MDSKLTPYTNINTKWNKIFNIKPETIKILEEKIDGKLLNVLDILAILQIDTFYCIYLDTKSKSNQSKNKQQDYIKLKSFCIAKQTINKMKRQPMEWEKIFANCITNKGVISYIHTHTHTHIHTHTYTQADMSVYCSRRTGYIFSVHAHTQTHEHTLTKTHSRHLGTFLGIPHRAN